MSWRRQDSCEFQNTAHLPALSAGHPDSSLGTNIMLAGSWAHCGASRASRTDAASEAPSWACRLMAASGLAGQGGPGDGRASRQAEEKPYWQWHAPLSNAVPLPCLSVPSHVQFPFSPHLGLCSAVYFFNFLKAL